MALTGSSSTSIDELEAHLRDAPEDAAAWQVYADWLIDQGDARGERVRLGTAEVAEDDNDRSTPRRAWLTGADAQRTSGFRHGFATGLALTFDARVPAVLAMLLADREARFVTKLELQPSRWDAPRVEGDPIDALATLDLRSITRLSLAYCAIGPRGASVLAALPGIENLVELDLRYCKIGDGGAAALAAAPLERLASLHLQRNGIGGDGLTTLARSPHLRALRRLDIRYNAVGRRGGRELAQSPNVARLASLLVYADDVGPGGGRALGRSPHLPVAIRRLWSAR